MKLNTMRQMIARYILTAAACLLSLCCQAQLTSLRPVSMTHLDETGSGAKDVAHIEILFSEPLQGVRVVKDSENSIPDSSREGKPGVAYAKGLAIESAGIYAGKVTVVHPDFAPCVIDFTSLGFTDRLRPGEYYRIEVEVPGMRLVEADKAFSQLDFTKAEQLYGRCLSEGCGKDSAMVRQRLAVIDELRTPSGYVAENAASDKKATLYRCLKAAEMIYDKTHSPKAYGIYNDFRKKLFQDGRNLSDYDDEGVTELIVDTVYQKQGDNRPMSDARLPKVDGQPYYSWINVNVDLDDVMFTGVEQYIPAERIDGVYRLYVARGPESAGEIVVHHPDCAPLSFSLREHGIESVSAASVYEVRIKTPPSLMIEADRAFGNLDFKTARMLYEEMLAGEDMYDDATLTLAADRLRRVMPLVENDVRGRWSSLRKDISLKGSVDSRDELSAKCLELASLADRMDSYGVPGMKRKAQIYRNLANEYKTAVFLTIIAKECDAKGNPVFDSNGDYIPYRSQEIVLEFDRIGDYKNIRLPLTASSKGVFKKYLPDYISRWLINNQGESIKARPKAEVMKGNGRGLELKDVGDKFEIYLEDDARSFTITQYLTNPK